MCMVSVGLRGGLSLYGWFQWVRVWGHVKRGHLLVGKSGRGILYYCLFVLPIIILTMSFGVILRGHARNLLETSTCGVNSKLI